MNSTKTNSVATTAEDDAKLKEALKEAALISDQIAQSNKDFDEKTANLKDKINTSFDEIEKIDADLDKEEEKTKDELDRLILEQAEDLSQDEEKDASL